MTTILILNNQKTGKMKKMFLLAIIGLNCLVANAQVCDLELLFHVSPQKTNRASSLIFCQGETKHTVWMDNAVDVFTFDDNGNLQSHNLKDYTDIVRDGNGILKEAVLDGDRYTFNITPTKIVVCQYKKHNNGFYKMDEYFLDKKGLVKKAITTYADGDTVTKTYNYEEMEDKTWYIRKVKRTSKYSTDKYYECLKSSGIYR